MAVPKMRPRGEILKAVAGIAEPIKVVEKVEKVVDVAEKVTGMVDMITRQEAESLALKAAEEASKRAVAGTFEEIGKRFVSGDMGGGIGRVGREVSEAVAGSGGGGIGEDVLEAGFVKRMEGMGKVFELVKKISSNPVQQAIESEVGSQAAERIKATFGTRPPEKRDIVDTVLNSQWAYGMGQELGKRSPELVDSLKRNFGQERAGQMLDGIIGITGRGGGGQVGQGQLSGSGGIGGSGGGEGIDDIVRKLDTNNPDHISYYAEKMKISNIETARKMLMIHQDDIIKRMEQQVPGQQNPGVGGVPGQQNPQSNEVQIVQVMSKLVDEVNNLKQALLNSNNNMVNLNNNMIALKGEIDDVKSGQIGLKNIGTDGMNGMNRMDKKREQFKEELPIDLKWEDKEGEGMGVPSTKPIADKKIVIETPKVPAFIAKEAEELKKIETEGIKKVEEDTDEFIKEGGIWKKKDKEDFKEESK